MDQKLQGYGSNVERRACKGTSQQQLQAFSNVKELIKLCSATEDPEEKDLILAAGADPGAAAAGAAAAGAAAGAAAHGAAAGAGAGARN